MQTDGPTDSPITYHPLVREPPIEAAWSHFAEDARRQFAARAAVAARHLRLVEEHRDLDELISYLDDSLAPDDALLSRLKKRRLALKDAIARIESPG